MPVREQPGQGREHDDRHRGSTSLRQDRRLLQDLRTRVDRGPRGARRGRHVPDDGLHHRAEPDHPAPGQGHERRRARRRELRHHRRLHRARRRRAHDPDGRRRELPARAGHRPGPQRLRDLLDRQPDDLGRRDGSGRDRGPGHPGAGAHRVPGGGLPRGPGPAEDRDLRRHRPLHRPDRPRRRRLRTPYRCRPGPRRARHRRPAPGLAGAGLRGRPGAGHRPLRDGCARRDPDLDRHHHAARDRRREGGPRRPDVHRRRGQPQGLEPQRARVADRRVRRSPTSGSSATSTCSAPGRTPAS